MDGRASTQGTLKILSTESTPFDDRSQAGELLADELFPYRGPDTIVLGIPRGGIVVAWAVARKLDCPADVILVRKLGAPGNPELAVGAVSEDGKAVLDRDLVWPLGIDDAYVQNEKARELAVIRQRAGRYRRILPKLPVEGKTVIVVDDGLATGSTMKAALVTLAGERPKKIVCAVPVAPDDTVSRLASYADELVCLKVPPFFAAVGQFYVRFDQVEDREVEDLLMKENERRTR